MYVLLGGWGGLCNERPARAWHSAMPSVLKTSIKPTLPACLRQVNHEQCKGVALQDIQTASSVCDNLSSTHLVVSQIAREFGDAAELPAGNSPWTKHDVSYSLAIGAPTQGGGGLKAVDRWRAAAA